MNPADYVPIILTALTAIITAIGGGLLKLLSVWREINADKILASKAEADANRALQKSENDADREERKSEREARAQDAQGLARSLDGVRVEMLAVKELTREQLHLLSEISRNTGDLPMIRATVDPPPPKG